MKTSRLSCLPLDLVVPLYNEGGNVRGLVEAVATSALREKGLQTLVLVDNGSRDDTRSVILELARTYPWIDCVFIDDNLGYGGGVYRGLQKTQSPWVGFFPGDHQISASDVAHVWELAQERYFKSPSEKFVAKGVRAKRLDNWSVRLTSWGYTFLANLFLRVRALDVNGLPKIFPRELMDKVDGQNFPGFSWDLHLLMAARELGYKLLEVPVVLQRRREGRSAWSGRKLQTYRLVWSDVKRLRRAHA